jgi:hypothetical protein
MKGIDFIEFCSSSKLICKIICRYDAQNALNNLSIQELSFIIMSVSLLNATLTKEFQTSPIRWFQEET